MKNILKNNNVLSEKIANQLFFIVWRVEVMIVALIHPITINVNIYSSKIFLKSKVSSPT